MKRKGLYSVVFAILMLLASHCAFAELTVYEEDFSDSVWKSESMLVESSITDALVEPSLSDDGTALEVSGKETDTLGSVKFTGKAFVSDLGILDTSKVYIYTQKIKFTGTPDSSFNMSFTDGLFHDGYAFYVGVKDGKFVFASSGSTNGMASAKEVGEGWHTLVSKIFYNTTESKYDFVTTVYDESNTMVWERLIRGTSIASTANLRKITYMFNNLNTESSVLVDDAKLYVTSGKGSATISDEDTDVVRNLEVTVALSDGMDISKITMKNEEGTELSAYEVVKTSPYTAKIEINELLGKNAQYTIDFDEALGIEDIVFTTKSQYVLDAVCSGEVDSVDGKKLTVNYSFNENSSIKKINCRMMGILYEGGQMIDAAIVNISPTEPNVNTELTQTLNFNKDIGENTQISIVFFENGAFIPMSTGIALE